MKTILSADTPARRTALYSMLLAAALMISYAESLLPPVIPGMKPGLSNLAVMISLIYSPRGAAAVSLARVLICAVLFGSAVSLALSAAGAVCSLCLLLIVRAVKVKIFSWVGVSILSALAHNGGQLAAAAVLMGNGAVMGLAPLLILSSIICGSLTGIIMNRAASVIEKYQGA